MKHSLLLLANVPVPLASLATPAKSAYLAITELDVYRVLLNALDPREDKADVTMVSREAEGAWEVLAIRLLVSRASFFFFSILKNTPSHRIVSFLVACNCLFGTCTSDKSCECSAGWINDSNSSLKCSVCAPGFYASEDGNECHGKKRNSITKRCLAWIAHTEFEFSQPVLLVP